MYELSDIKKKYSLPGKLAIADADEIRWIIQEYENLQVDHSQLRSSFKEQTGRAVRGWEKVRSLEKQLAEKELENLELKGDIVQMSNKKNWFLKWFN